MYFGFTEDFPHFFLHLHTYVHVLCTNYYVMYMYILCTLHSNGYTAILMSHTRRVLVGFD